MALACILLVFSALVVGAASCGNDESHSTTSPPPAGGTGPVGGAGGTGNTGGGGGATGGSDIGPCCDETVVECPGVTLTPAATGTCAVTVSGTSGSTLLRGTVLAPDTLYRNGGVLYDAQGIIQCVGCGCENDSAAAGAAMVDCALGVISPGLINPHDHITYANNAPIDHGTIRYEHRHDWRTGTHGHVELDYNSGASQAEVLAAELRFIMGGATSTASAGGQPRLLRNVDRDNLREGLPVPVTDLDTFPLDDISGILRTSGCDYGSNPTTAAEISGDNAYVPHIGEGIDVETRNELLCTSQGVTDLMKPQTAVIHAMALNASDAVLLRERRTGVIWSPRSNVDLYGNTAPVTLLHEAGVQISVGTDWMPSGSMNMLRELRCAADLNSDYFGGYFSDFELWQMATTNAAFAVGIDRGAGMLKRGYVADIAIFDAAVNLDYRAVIDATEREVVLVLRGGEPLFGDGPLMANAAVGAAACEDLDACGRLKKACVAVDTGGQFTLAGLRAAGEAYYPLLGCGAPPGEPSCVPYRDTYADGITAGDADGDGVADGSDNCPAIFNPVRLLETAQADGDADGAGDVCDPCPMDPQDACPAVYGNDIDGDGVSNGWDNCPDLPNADQADADDDGHGDLCDSCDEPNPGLSGCTYAVRAVRDPSDPNHPASGTIVTIADLYVTAVKPDEGTQRGFYAQDTSLLPLTGIYVFTGSSSPGVQVGNRVTISGVYEEYWDVSEITLQSATVLDAGTTLPFEPLWWRALLTLQPGAPAPRATSRCSSGWRTSRCSWSTPTRRTTTTSSR